MWRDAEPDWLWLAWDGASDAVVAYGEAGAAAARDRRIPEASWRAAWRRYLNACEAVEAATFATFFGDHAVEVAAAQDVLRASCCELYALITDAAEADLGTRPTVAARGAVLRSCSLARVVAAARPALLAARRLPWDLPVGSGRAELPGLAHAVIGWLLPEPANLTILAPREWELERLIAPRARDADQAVVHAWLGSWLVELETGLARARDAGAEVIRPATTRDLLAVLDGGHRPCLQVIGHIDRDVMFLDGERLKLRALATELSTAVARGWRARVRTADLSLCDSEALLAPVLRRAGVEYVSARAGKIHLGATARWVRTLYERGLFDGATPVGHAWLLAALGGAT